MFDTYPRKRDTEKINKEQIKKDTCVLDFIYYTRGFFKTSLYLAARRKELFHGDRYYNS